MINFSKELAEHQADLQRWIDRGYSQKMIEIKLSMIRNCASFIIARGC